MSLRMPKIRVENTKALIAFSIRVAGLPPPLGLPQWSADSALRATAFELPAPAGLVPMALSLGLTKRVLSDASSFGTRNLVRRTRECSRMNVGIKYGVSWVNAN